MAEYGYIQWWQLPDSKSQLDRWSDRAIRLAQAQWFLAGTLIFAESLNSDSPSSRIHYDHEVMPKWKILAASPTVLLPIISCLPRFPADVFFILWNRRSPTASDNVSLSPVLFSLIQTLQLVECILLTGYDFIQYAPGPVFWISLIIWFSPALMGFLWGLIGLQRFRFLAPSYSRAVHTDGPTELCQDSPEEDGLLGQAYLLQQEQQNLTSGQNSTSLSINLPDCNNDTPQPSAPLETSSDQQAVSLDPQETINQTPSSGIPSPPRHWVKTPQPVSETSFRNPTRFRWQERRNLRNGGAIFWTPWILIGGMSITCVRMGTYALTHTWGLTPEIARHIKLTAWLPPAYSIISRIVALRTLRHPRFTIIFASFCTESLGVIIWLIVFIDAVVDFATHLPYGLAFPALALILGHLCLAINAVNMEWGPGCSSMLSEMRRMRRQEPQDI